MWYKYRHDACGGTSLWKEEERQGDFNYYSTPLSLTCGVCHEQVLIHDQSDIREVDDLSDAIYNIRYPNPPTRND